LEPAVTSLESLQGCYDFLWNSAGLLAFEQCACLCFFPQIITVIIIYY